MNCSRCKKSLEFRHSGVEFISFGGGYPDYAADTRLVYVCDDCEAVGYYVDFPGLVRDGLDGPNGWRTHISRKTWCGGSMESALEEAYRFACALMTDKPILAMRSVVDSIPRRRPRVPNNPRAISAGLRARVFERDGFRCRRCGANPRDARLVVDHIMPVASGGTAALENLQTLCDPCNAGKSARAPHEHDTAVVTR